MVLTESAPRRGLTRPSTGAEYRTPRRGRPPPRRRRDRRRTPSPPPRPAPPPPRAPSSPPAAAVDPSEVDSGLPMPVLKAIAKEKGAWSCSLEPARRGRPRRAARDPRAAVARRPGLGPRREHREGGPVRLITRGVNPRSRRPPWSSTRSSAPPRWRSAGPRGDPPSFSTPAHKRVAPGGGSRGGGPPSRGDRADRPRGGHTGAAACTAGGCAREHRRHPVVAWARGPAQVWGGRRGAVRGSIGLRGLVKGDAARRCKVRGVHGVAPRTRAPSRGGAGAARRARRGACGRSRDRARARRALAGKLHAADLAADALHRALGGPRASGGAGPRAGRALVAMSGGVDSAVARCWPSGPRGRRGDAGAVARRGERRRGVVLLGAGRCAALARWRTGWACRTSRSTCARTSARAS